MNLKNGLIEKLEDYLRQPFEYERSIAFHPSMLYDFCMRWHYFMYKHSERLKQIALNPLLRVIFDIGRAIHKKAQEEWFGRSGLLYGKWKCYKCNNTVKGFYPDFFCKCQECKSENPRINAFNKWCYIEPSIKVKDLWLEASIDGLVYFNKEFFLLELKTINESGFRYCKLSKKNKFQTQIYLNLLQTVKMDIPKPKRAFVVYINKNCIETGINFETYFPMKAYVVELDREAKEQWQFTTGKIKKCISYIEKDEVPPYSRCSAKQRKDCIFKDLCKK